MELLPKEIKSIPILVVPFPAQGHLNQLLHFSLTLASHGFPVHFASSSVHNRQARDRIRGWTSKSLHNITFHDIPTPSLPSNDVPNPNSAHKFPSHILPVWDSVLRDIRSPLSSLLHSLSSSSPRLILVHDPLMSSVAQDAAAIPSVETYKFQCISALTQLSFIWEINGKAASSEDNEILFSPLEDTITKGVQDFLNVYYVETPAEGILLNTCRAIEGPFIDLLGKEDNFISKKMFAVGPISPVIVQSPQRHACLEWLDKQPPESVVYVAFGSTTTLSDEQIKEIALGLERSKQRFIWVLRDADRGDVSVEGELKREKSLLTDFDERVEGVGMVVRGWAPQLDILAHPSTGAFMSHCGWNSCMEGMSMGLPILTWPMHSDQPRHALMITEHLKVGVMVRDWGKRNETTKGEEVEMAVKKVMVDEQGKEIRRRAKELGESIRAATKEGGSSHEELKAFIAHITRDVE